MVKPTLNLISIGEEGGATSKKSEGEESQVGHDNAMPGCFGNLITYMLEA